MVALAVSPTDQLEAILARSRRGVEEIFRRYSVPLDEAQDLLLEALPRIESLQGAVPGAGHRLLKLVEAACRRSRGEGPKETSVSHDYSRVFDAASERLRQRRTESNGGRQARAAALAQIEDWCAGRAPRPSLHQLTKEVVVRVLDRAYELRKTDPRLSLVLSHAVLDLLREPGTLSLTDRQRADLEARGHAVAGNAHRLLEDYRSAERAFVAAQAALGRGTQDPRERALLLRLIATLRRDQRRFDDALRQFQQAAAIYRWVRDPHLEGRIYLQMAIVNAYAGRPDLAIPLAERSAELIDALRDPALAASLEHNLVHFLCAAEQPQEARKRLPRARKLMIQRGSPRDLTALRWVEAQIAFALGEHDEGERLLLGVREEFIEAGNRYDTALVSLELAAEYLDQGRSTDARRLAAETLPIFQSLEVHREALAALIAVQRAIELETATAELVRELLATLQRARNGPPPRPEQPS